jgi:holo-[acyl-carrier protein] synthase
MGTSSLVVGLDLVLVGAIAASVERFGRRFLDRIYTEGELRYCLLDAGPSAMRLAARFAAKEAVRKVLCVDDEAVTWRSIEVLRSARGSCAIALHDEARALALESGLVGFSLSMTHEAEYASAVVVAERRQNRGTS